MEISAASNPNQTASLEFTETRASHLPTIQRLLICHIRKDTLGVPERPHFSVIPPEYAQILTYAPAFIGVLDGSNKIIQLKLKTYSRMQRVTEVYPQRAELVRTTAEIMNRERQKGLYY